jgi:hypothetical protein
VRDGRRRPLGMYFLAMEEGSLLEKKLRRQIAGQPKPKLILYYESSNRDYAPAAKAITASIGEFTKATLLFTLSVTGDGWTEGPEINKRWNGYRQWRKACGDTRRLYDAPGHQFDGDEAEHLSKVLDFALQLGWDA